MTTLVLTENKCVNNVFRSQGNEVLTMDSVKTKLEACFDNFPKQMVFCIFESKVPNYICRLHNVHLEKDKEIIISGKHLPGKSDSDVTSVIFDKLSLQEIPQEIFTKFENLKVLNVASTGLEELNRLENCGSLESFKAPSNHLVKINNETFADCKFLKTVNLQSNKIVELGRNVFKNNEELQDINLSHNEIKSHNETF